MTNEERPKPRPGILEIAAYVPGRHSAAGGGKVHKLSSNETPLGASAAAIAAVKETAGHLELYPDGSATALRDAIASMHGLDPANIVCGNGSDDLLALLTRSYLQPGDEGIFSQHGFLVYKIQILAAGAMPVVAPEKDECADVDALLAAVTDRTRMVFLANPNNPTGTYLPFKEVCRLHAGLPKHVLLVLDAAYAEYVRKGDYEAGIALVSSAQNVVMTRTFSKIYGLAGLRLGWMYAPARIADAINRVRDPFNVSAAAIAAGTAAMRDRVHVERAVAHNEQWRDWLAKELSALGLRITPSVGNFLLIHFPGAKHSAEEADRFLYDRGYILRRVAAYGFPNALRMTVGSEEANRGVVQALATFLKA